VASLACLLIASAAAPVARSADLPLARFETAGKPADEVPPLLARVLQSDKDSNRVLPEDAGDDEAALRRLQRRAADALATEGYFSPQMTLSPDPLKQARYRVQVDAGTRAHIERVDLTLQGAIESMPDRVTAMRESWELPVGRPFRDADWTKAKARLIARVQEKDFPAARIVESNARVDAAAATVVLTVRIDTGPRFRFGLPRITGLHRYDASLVERFNSIQAADPYDAERLQELQRKLQACGYFSSVLVDIDPDPATADHAPILIQLTEVKTQRVAFGAGYSTNVGPQAQASYRRSLLFGAPYTWQSGAGYDRTRAVGYTDLYLPPHPNGAIDSLGLLAEHTDINDVQTRRWAAGVTRQLKRQSAGIDYNTRFEINYQHELRTYTGAVLPPSTINEASATLTWTRNRVDQVTDPTRGDIVTLSGTGGLSAPLSDLRAALMTRAYARYVRYVPLSPANQWIVRGEGGYLFADRLDQVPSEFLFRAGGVGSVRGFSYLSLGQQVGNSTLGSRSLVTASNEVVHWFGPRWGAAAFFDTGNAGNPVELSHLARGYGLGARWRTLAGPLALDFAYGERTIDGQGGRWRLHFSVAIAF
jgi:translocation and assembly module TamA